MIYYDQFFDDADIYNFFLKNLFAFEMDDKEIAEQLTAQALSLL